MAVDNWEHIINLMTGFTLGERGEIMEAKGDGGVPWLTNINIQELGKPARGQVLVQRVNADGMGATFQFFSGTGSGVRLYQADVGFTDQTAGRQYWQRSYDALVGLARSPYSTVGASSNYGGSPSQENGVDLRSFTTLALSFDKAGTFFNSHAEILKQWTEALGDENASWKGTAAGVFWDLINLLYEKYEHFKSELSPPGFSSTATAVATNHSSPTIHGNSLIEAENALHRAYVNMFDDFVKFMYRSATPITVSHPDGSQSGRNIDGDPRAVLVDIMNELIVWINNYNTSKTGMIEGTADDDGQQYGDYVSDDKWLTLPDYRDSTVWGNLKDQSTWSAISNEARYRWRVNIETNLDTPARAEVKTLQENWSRVLNPGWNTAFAFDDASTVSLTQAFQQDQLDKQEEEAENAANEANENMANFGKDFNDAMSNFGKDLNDFGDGLGGSLSDFGNDFGNIFSSAGGGGTGGLNLDGLGGTGGLNLDDLGGTGGGLGGTDGLTNPTVSGFGSDSVLGSTDGLSLDGLGGTGGLTNPTVSGFGSDSVLGDPNTLTSGLPTGIDGLGTTGIGDPNSLLSDPTGSGGLNPDGTPTLGEVSSFGSDSTLGTVPPIGLPFTGTGTGGTGGSLSTFGNGSLPTADSFGENTTINPDGSITTEYPDGSSTTVSPNGEITTTNPDGTITTSTLAPGQSILNPDGSVTSVDANGDITTQFPDGTSVTHNADGSVSTLNSDGSLTTEFPDGSSTTVTPDGETTTVSPSGISTFGNLTPGEFLTNPDGSLTSVDSDGNITTEYPDGTSVTHNADGSITNTDANGNETTTFSNGVVESTTPDGLTQLTAPSGTVSTQNADGSLTMDFPDGSSTTISPDGTVSTIKADGSEVTSQLGENQSVVNPDGSRTALTDDGGFTTTYPDGSSITVNPDGTVTSTPPTGGTGSTGGLTGFGNTGSLGGLGSLGSLGGSGGTDIPTVSGFGSSGLTSDPGGLTFDNGDGSLSTTFPTGTTSTLGSDGFTTTQFPDGSSTITSPDGQFQAVPSQATADAGTPAAQPLGSGGTGTSPSATGDDSGMSALGGLMSPMMMMMGMARMASQGQGQGQGQGDRTRETYQENDADGPFVAAGGYQQRPAERPAPEVFEEEDEDPVEVPSRTPTTGQGGQPGDAAGWRPETEDSGWNEEEDVWGTGEEGLPASIGR
ncbi:AAWKG family protein [Streptomyces sp. NPDC004610]|uniref:AAWKG family protein n=1 Tax=unclassified Streptomyces TaxID=2593676 RepID=UPI0033B3AD4C